MVLQKKKKIISTKGFPVSNTMDKNALRGGCVEIMGVVTGRMEKFSVTALETAGGW